MELTDDEFRKLETALNACTVYGHRGHVETEQVDFGKIGKTKRKDRIKKTNNEKTYQAVNGSIRIDCHPLLVSSMQSQSLKASSNENIKIEKA